MPEKPRRLSEKQDRFCREYVIDGNAYQAALRADYSETTARVKSGAWLGKVRIKQRIDELKARITKKLDVTAERVVAELAKLGFSNINDFVVIDEDGETSFKSFEGMEIDKLAAVESIKVSKTENKDGDRQYTTTNFKLYNKADALEKLCRYLGIFRDNAPNAEKEAAKRSRMSKEDRKIAEKVAKDRTDEESDEPNVVKIA